VGMHAAGSAVWAPLVLSLDSKEAKERSLSVRDEPAGEDRSRSMPFSRCGVASAKCDQRGSRASFQSSAGVEAKHARCRSRSAPPERMASVQSPDIRPLEHLAAALTSEHAALVPIMASLPPPQPTGALDELVTPQDLPHRASRGASAAQQGGGRRDRGGRRKPRKTPSPEQLQGALLAAPALSVWVSATAPVQELSRVLEDAFSADAPPAPLGADCDAPASSAEGADETEHSAELDGTPLECGSDKHDSNELSSAFMADAMNDGVLEALVTLLTSTTAAALARAAAAAAFKRLALQPSIASRLIDVGAVDALCDVCSTPLPRDQVGGLLSLMEQAVRAVGNLAAHEGMPATLHSYGCAKSLVRRLDTDDSSVLEAALCALSNLAELPATRVEIASTGLGLLLSATLTSAPRISAQAGWLVCLVASDCDAAAYLISHPKGLDALFEHARRPQMAAKEEAAWALATLSAYAQHAKTLGASSAALQLLLELLANPCTAISLQAAWALANLALQPVARTRLSLLESLPTLLDAAQRHDDPLLRRQSLRCLGSLLTELEMRNKLLQMHQAGQPTLAVLLDIACGPSSELVDAAIRALAHTCQHPYSAAAAIASMEGGLALLQRLLCSSAASTHCEAASCIANIAYSASKDSNLLEHTSMVPFIAPLVSLLESESKRTQAQAALALCNISAIADCRMHIIEAGALTALRHVAGSKHVDAQEASRRALDAVTQSLTPNSRRVFLKQPHASIRGSGKANNQRSPLAVDTSSVRRRGSWASPLSATRQSAAQQSTSATHEPTAGDGNPDPA